MAETFPITDEFLERDQALSHNPQFISKADELLERHLANSKSWYHHELIQWDHGRNYDSDNPWDPAESPLTPGEQSALYVNLLTEDNLPHYTTTIQGLTDKSHPLSHFNLRWTAEEGRHSPAIRDLILVERLLDPRMLEDGRMSQVSRAEVPRPPSVIDSLAYVSLQELATNIAHRNTGRHMDKDTGGRKVMARVAGDEWLHHIYYRDLTKKALEIDASTVLVAIARQLTGFHMPGTGIPGFTEHSKAIAEEGIYNFAIFKDDVVEPTLSAWQLDRPQNLSDEGELAREKIHRFVRRLGKAAARFSRG